MLEVDTKAAFILSLNGDDESGVCMKSFTEYLYFKTSQKQEFVNITDQVREALGKSGIKEGLCLVSPMHITASVFTDDENSMQKSG